MDIGKGWVTVNGRHILVDDDNISPNRALDLIESPTSKTILGHIDGSGNVIRYDKTKNDFAKGKPSKGLITMYKPIEYEKYYEQQLKEDLKNGGKT